MHALPKPLVAPFAIVSLVLSCLSFTMVPHARGQAAASSGITVVGQELPSAYGAPPAFSRTRFSPNVTAYVLPPGSVLAATIYEGDVFRKGIPANLFTQEIEVGLPYRFGVATEFALEHYQGVTQARSVSLEARYALADWNKIPLNPTLFAEYKFGTGRILRDEALNQPAEEPMPVATLRRLSSPRHSVRGQEEPPPGEEDMQPDLPDAVEGRLLLSQDFGDYVDWAANGFFEREVGGDRGQEWGFAQSIIVPFNKAETFKAGVEMQYLEFSDKGIRDEPEQRFTIGPTFSWKPARWCHLDVSELFGTTPDSERARTFVVFSMVFGGGGKETEAEAPVSTRNR